MRATIAMKTLLKKLNLRLFKLYSVFLEPLNWSNVGDFSWVFLKDFVPVQNEKGKFVFVCSRPPFYRRFHVAVVQWTSKKYTKKRDTRAELLFCS